MTALVLVTALVGCGNGNGADDDQAASATTIPTTPPTTTTAGVASPPTSVACASVGFTPNSDNVAGNIVALGLSCTAATALVRKVGAPLGPNGPSRAEADGYTCVRTGQSSVGLESATYECTNGARKVSFLRT